MNQLLRYSACEQTAKIRSKEISAVELCQAYLSRIGTLQESIGAYLRVDEEGALEQAAEVDRKVQAEQPLGVMAGICVGLKDLLVTRGVETTAASKILEGWVPHYDASVVTSLRDADAVILGKLNMDEFAMGSSNEHTAYDRCANPWDIRKVPGGSSGGSAAAVAAHLCAISLGTDTGGSIRQPAAFCGVMGLKPSYGRVSRYGVIAYASSLDQVGPITRSAQDAALVLEVIAGRDKRDATSSDTPVPNYRDACNKKISGLTIGIVDEWSEGESCVADAVGNAVDEFKKQGACVRRVSLPHTQYALSSYYLIATAEASSNLSRYDGIRFGPRKGDSTSLREMMENTRGSGFGAEVKRRIMLGTFALRTGYYDQYYKKAQQVRWLIARDFRTAFSDVDLIVSPTTPTTAFEFGAKSTPMEMYKADEFTLSCNLAGLSGVSINCGFDTQGMPIGLQLLAPPMQEEKLLQCAAQYQAATDWHNRSPETWDHV